MRRGRAGAAGGPPGRGAASAALLALVALALPGCATFARAPGEAEPVAIPADASPELLFLAARDRELEGDLGGALALYQRAAERDPSSAYLRRKVAELAARQGQFDDALEAARSALALDPEDAELRVFAARLLRVARRDAEAEEVLRGPEGEPVSDEAASLLYGIHLDHERYEEALELGRWMLERDPPGDRLRGYLALATVYERQGKAEALEEVLRQALAEDADDLRIYHFLARVRREQDDREGEIEVYREVLEKFPTHRPSLQAIAEAQLALGQVVEATETLRTIEKLYPDDLRTTVRLALLDFEAGRYREAAERFRRVFEASPTQYDVAYFLGLVYERAGDLDAALSALKRVPPGHERYAQARTQMAAILEKRGELEAALEEVERARAAGSTRPLDLYYASLLARSGRFDEAVAFLEDLLAENPDDDEILYNLGVLYGERKLREQALRYMEQALQKNPDNASALNYLGYSFAERGERLDEAEELIRRALELRPDDGYITDSLGWVYYMRARQLLEEGEAQRARELAQQALEQLHRAAELTGGDPVISEHLGDAYLLLGRKREALERYLQAMEQGPRADEQPELPAKVERLRGELGSP